jgi:hypothetical protein
LLVLHLALQERLVCEGSIDERAIQHRFDSSGYMVTCIKVKISSTNHLNICVHREFMGVRSYNNFVMFFEFLLNETI